MSTLAPVDFANLMRILFLHKVGLESVEKAQSDWGISSNGAKFRDKVNSLIATIYVTLCIFTALYPKYKSSAQ
jgi:hypothetical protein